MKAAWFTSVFFVFALGLGWSIARADDPPQFPQNATFTTKAITPFAIEGLTGDATGNLYTTGRQPDTTKKCPVWRINPDGARVTVGFIQNNPACNPSGITFDSVGNLYIADAASGGIIWSVNPDATGCSSDDSANAVCASIPTGTAFASGVPGTNGLAFDRDGNLWTGDGTSGRGRVWRIGPSGGVCEPSFTGCHEVFRIQPMRNSSALGGDLAGDGVGRQARTFPPGTLLNSAGGQDLVANGLAFDPAGRRLFVVDTARGAIWKIELEKDGSVESKMSCDETFIANTLCLNHENIFVAHPLLEGADGIVLDINGNVWVDANERNAVIFVSSDGKVFEAFRNPANSAGLRNSADDPPLGLGNNHILEFPASPFITGRTLCTSSSDGNRRDNSPNSAGEINSGGPAGARGKISCMDQELITQGLPLPIQ